MEEIERPCQFYQAVSIRKIEYVSANRYFLVLVSDDATEISTYCSLHFESVRHVSFESNKFSRKLMAGGINIKLLTDLIFKFSALAERR